MARLVHERFDQYERLSLVATLTNQFYIKASLWKRTQKLVFGP